MDQIGGEYSYFCRYNNANVRMAAKTLINLFRDEDRTKLHRKDRTKPTVAQSVRG